MNPIGIPRRLKSSFQAYFDKIDRLKGPFQFGSLPKTSPKPQQHSPTNLSAKPLIHRRKIPQVRHVVLVASGKGGVGKSTVSVNLALALSKRGWHVGLLDMDLHGPSLPRLMNLASPRSSSGSSDATADPPLVQINPRTSHFIPVHNYGIECMSLGLLIPESQSTIWRGPMVQKTVHQLLWQVEWHGRDVVVVDLPPGTGDVGMNVCMGVDVSGALVVTTPQYSHLMACVSSFDSTHHHVAFYVCLDDRDIALVDVGKGLDMFRKLQVGVMGVVENMAYFSCPKCGHESHVFGQSHVSPLSRQLLQLDTANRNGNRNRRRDEEGDGLKGADERVRVVARVPLDGEICELSDQGKPVVLVRPESAGAKAYMEMADHVIQHLQALDKSSVG